MRHRFLAIDVFSGGYGVDHYLFVPVVGYRRDQAIDILIREQFLVAARGRQLWIVGDLACECVAAIIKIAGGNALDTRKIDGGTQQPITLHTYTDDPEMKTIAG